MISSIHADGSFVVTNDETRDHRISLVEPRAFNRWREANCAKFSFSRVEGALVRTNIQPLAPFSREIQREGCSWLLPIDKGGNDEVALSERGLSWVCVRIPEGSEAGGGLESMLPTSTTRLVRSSYQ